MRAVAAEEDDFMHALTREHITLAQLLKHNLVHLRDMALVEFGSYLLIGALAFVFVLHVSRRGLFRRLIRRPTPTSVQVRREVHNSALSVVLYNGVQLGARVVALGFGFVFTLNTKLPLWEFALSFPLVIVVHDAYFYWTHRIMHHPAIFRLFHWEHHKSQATTVFTAYSFAIPEAIVQGLFGVFYVAFFPANMFTLVFFQTSEIVYNLAIHSGIEVFPRALVTHPRFGWLAGATHHDLHHRTARGNYGLYFRFWDRLMKTEHPDFVRIFEYVNAPANDAQAYRLLARSATRADQVPVLAPAVVP